MRDCRLECVQAVIERQKRMPAEANDDRLFLDRQHRRSRFLWSRPSVHDRAARLPLAHRLLIDAVTSGERSQALFTMLYRSTDRLSRRQQGLRCPIVLITSALHMPRARAALRHLLPLVAITPYPVSEDRVNT